LDVKYIAGHNPLSTHQFISSLYCFVLLLTLHTPVQWVAVKHIRLFTTTINLRGRTLFFSMGSSVKR